MKYTILLKSGKRIYCSKYRTVEHGISYQLNEDTVPEFYISASAVAEVFPETEQERELWSKLCDWLGALPINSNSLEIHNRVGKLMQSNISRSELILKLTDIIVKWQSDEIDAMPKKLQQCKDNYAKALKEKQEIEKENKYLIKNRAFHSRFALVMYLFYALISGVTLGAILQYLTYHK